MRQGSPISQDNTPVKATPYQFCTCVAAFIYICILLRTSCSLFCHQGPTCHQVVLLNNKVFALQGKVGQLGLDLSN